MLSYTTYIHTIKPPVVTRHDPKTNASSASNQTSAPPYHSTPMASKEIRKDKVYSQRAEQCRFIGYADDVNWTNTQISSYDSYIVLMKDGILSLFSTANILRPLISEGALTSSPNNLSIVKKGIYAWILDSTKTRSDPDWILCYCTKESDNLYHLYDPSKQRQYRSPVTVSYGLIESSPVTKPKGNRQLTHNQSYGNFNPLEVLHVILGHISESTIKRIV